MAQPQPVVYAQPPQTVVVVQQNTIGVVAQTNAWTFGIFDCFSDIFSCVKVWLCYPCVIGCMKAEVDGSSGFCNVCCFCCCVPCGARQAVRAKIGIAGSCLEDWFWVYFCPHCAGVQMVREWERAKTGAPPTAMGMQ